jgi:hypothetical protein
MGAGASSSGDPSGGDAAATVVRTAKKVLEGQGGLSLADLVAHATPRSVMLKVGPVVTRSPLGRTLRCRKDAVEAPAEVPCQAVSVLGIFLGPEAVVEARVSVDDNTATRGYLVLRWRNTAVPGYTTLAINPYTVHLLGCRSRFSVLRSGEEVRDRFGKRVGVVDRLHSPGTLMFEHDDMPARQVAAEVDLFLEVEDDPPEGAAARTHVVFIVPSMVERYGCGHEPAYGHVCRVRVPMLPMLAFLGHVSMLPTIVQEKRRAAMERDGGAPRRPALPLASKSVAPGPVLTLVAYTHCEQCRARDAAFKCPCGSVRYCSKACQAAHWQASHKDGCSSRKRVRPKGKKVG